MCGIIAAIAKRDVAELLLDGLAKLEYRGYDSAGIAVGMGQDLSVLKKVGKVSELCAAYAEQDASDWRGAVGIGHTRWATHGEVNEANAHPHRAGDVVLVHNGIIENHGLLRDELRAHGVKFESTTDSEVIAQLISFELKTETDFKAAVVNAANKLQGAFAIAVMCARFPNQIIALREGSPLVLGVGGEEYFFASDVLALGGLTQNIIFLESGDLVQADADGYQVYNAGGEKVQRDIKKVSIEELAVEKGEYRHFMQKEIFEQKKSLVDTYAAIEEGVESFFGAGSEAVFKTIKSVQIVACGTSYHAGAVARYLFESCGVLTRVEVASEFLYRDIVVPESCLLVLISQSGETADTLAALGKASDLGYKASLAICNVANSSLQRACDFACLTRAGREIGVAATKTFTAQLLALQALACALCGSKMFDLQSMQQELEFVLDLDSAMRVWAQDFVEKNHALYLARGKLFPVAQEGALKLKEISYLHAEAYPAGELKHGPLALIDEDIPIVALAPDDELLDKMLSNLEEVSARGGKLYILASRELDLPSQQIKVCALPDHQDMLRAIIYTIPLQLLAYHVAALKGTDVDQPRNLAKSVTVE